MRRYIIATSLSVIALGALSACASTQTLPPVDDATAARVAESHFPEPFANAYLGMPLAKWRASRADVAMPGADGAFDFRISVTEKAPAPNVAEATWYFAAKVEGQPLYEVIVDYGDHADALKRAVDALGPPNAPDGEWRYATSGDHTVKVWTFGTKIVVAANMKGSEWESEW